MNPLTPETLEHKKGSTTLVIADDHRLFREALRQVLKTDPSLDVVGEAGDGREAIRLVRELRPDVLLLDLLMPVASGLETLRALSTTTTAVRTLVLTAEVSDSDIVDALQLGARGVVMKHDACELLFKGIRTIMAGQYWVGRDCMGGVIEKMRARRAAPWVESPKPTFRFTPRELQVVSTVVNGFPNADIAEKFSITVSTVKHHLTEIFKKVGVSTRLELAVFAVQHRLDSYPPAPEPAWWDDDVGGPDEP